MIKILKMRTVNILILVLILSFLPNLIFSQSFTAGGGVGFTSYVGELNEGRVVSYFNNWEPLISAEMSYSPQKYFAINGQLFYGKLYGSDDLASDGSFMRERNLNFSSNIYGIALKGDLQSTDVADKHNFPVSIFATGGVEFFHFNPTTSLWGQRYFLRDLGTGGQGIEGYGEKYSLWTFSIQGGGGLKIRITPDIIIKMELVYHKTFTDFLDDVGGTELPDYELLKHHNGEVSAMLSDRSWEYLGTRPGEKKFANGRGSASSKDGFVAGLLSFQYIFPDF